MNKLKSNLINLLIFIISLLLMLGISEFIFRKLLFGNFKTFKSLRDPGFYSDFLNEDDYWKLYYMFGGEAKPPENPHPLLGWIGDFNRNTLLHNDSWRSGEKRPVLLYGDSYAQCMSEVECFEDILNSDSAFSKNHHFINYGVGGFGVDQIHLLFKNSSYYHRNPFVVFSLMTYDIDRTPMTFRTGQKPFFELDDDSLVLKGVPVDPNPDNFISQNPPGINSYLYRRFLYSDANILPESLNSKLKKWNEYTNHKIQLNERILLETIKILRERNQDFIFLIFHYLKPGSDEYKVESEDNWRDRFLREFLAKNEIPYLWSKDIIKKDPGYTGSNYDQYMILENGHPTTYFNKLIANEIKVKLEENESLRNADLEFVSSKIIKNQEWLITVMEKSEKEHIPLEMAIQRDAEYLVNELVTNRKIFPGPGYFEFKIRNNSALMKGVLMEAPKNNRTVDQQIQGDAMEWYNNEIENSRTRDLKSLHFDQQVQAITDSLSGLTGLEPDVDSQFVALPHDLKTRKKVYEIYNSRVSKSYEP